jgi:phage terminase Nu1 subunit (DNA packaging protein)
MRGTRKPTEDEQRLVAARADKVELEVQSKKGELVSVKDTEKKWAAMVIGFRNKMLTIPTALAPELSSMDSPAEIIHEALSELSGK